jgi:hypothetical protein
MPASPLIIARDRERTRQLMADVLAGAKRAPSDIAGMPSDIAAQVGNLGKAAVGYVGGKTGMLRPDQLPELDQRPVLGSDWMAQKAGLPERTGRPGEARRGHWRARSGPAGTWSHERRPEGRWQGRRGSGVRAGVARGADG